MADHTCDGKIYDKLDKPDGGYVETYSCSVCGSRARETEFTPGRID